jgi:hypothetical protein
LFCVAWFTNSIFREKNVRTMFIERQDETFIKRVQRYNNDSNNIYGHRLMIYNNIQALHSIILLSRLLINTAKRTLQTYIERTIRGWIIVLLWWYDHDDVINNSGTLSDKVTNSNRPNHHHYTVSYSFSIEIYSWQSHTHTHTHTHMQSSTTIVIVVVFISFNQPLSYHIVDLIYIYIILV